MQNFTIDQLNEITNTLKTQTKYSKKPAVLNHKGSSFWLIDTKAAQCGQGRFSPESVAEHGFVLREQTKAGIIKTHWKHTA